MWEESIFHGDIEGPGAYCTYMYRIDHSSDNTHSVNPTPSPTSTGTSIPSFNIISNIVSPSPYFVNPLGSPKSFSFHFRSNRHAASAISASDRRGFSDCTSF